MATHGQPRPGPSSTYHGVPDQSSWHSGGQRQQGWSSPQQEQQHYDGTAHAQHSYGSASAAIGGVYAGAQYGLQQDEGQFPGQFQGHPQFAGRYGQQPDMEGRYGQQNIQNQSVPTHFPVVPMPKEVQGAGVHSAVLVPLPGYSNHAGSVGAPQPIASAPGFEHIVGYMASNGFLYAVTGSGAVSPYPVMVDTEWQAKRAQGLSAVQDASSGAGVAAGAGPAASVQQQPVLSRSAAPTIPAATPAPTPHRAQAQVKVQEQEPGRERGRDRDGDRFRQAPAPPSLVQSSPAPPVAPLSAVLPSGRHVQGMQQDARTVPVKDGERERVLGPPGAAPAPPGFQPMGMRMFPPGALKVEHGPGKKQLFSGGGGGGYGERERGGGRPPTTAVVGPILVSGHAERLASYAVRERERGGQASAAQPPPVPLASRPHGKDWSKRRGEGDRGGKGAKEGGKGQRGAGGGREKPGGGTRTHEFTVPTGSLAVRVGDRG